jgi:hypothetical protein
LRQNWVKLASMRRRWIPEVGNIRNIRTRRGTDEHSMKNRTM